MSDLSMEQVARQVQLLQQQNAEKIQQLKEHDPTILNDQANVLALLKLRVDYLTEFVLSFAVQNGAEQAPLIFALGWETLWGSELEKLVSNLNKATLLQGVQGVDVSKLTDEPAHRVH